MEKDPIEREAAAPRIVWLRGKLEQLSGQPVKIPSDISLVEQLLVEGAPVPNYNPAKDQGKPTEEWLLLEILKLLPGKYIRQDVADYMANRGYLERPPANSVPELVDRQLNASIRELVDVFGGINDEIKRQKRAKLVSSG